MGTPRTMTPQEAADWIDAIDGADPERAHGEADNVLLASVDPLVADAYRRLIGRCGWWAGA